MRRSYTVMCDGTRKHVTLTDQGKIDIDGKVYEAEFIKRGDGEYFLRINNRVSHVFYKEISDTEGEFYSHHAIISTIIENTEQSFASRFKNQEGAGSSVTTVRAPMPGLITSIEVKNGDTVHPGSGLIILEAMKMENEIRSTVHGKVKHIEVQTKETVEKNQPLIHIEVMLKQ